MTFGVPGVRRTQPVNREVDSQLDALEFRSESRSLLPP